MKITKFGHACLFLQDGGDVLVIDPGKFTDLPENLENIQSIIISEEHYDHFDLDNVQKILKQSPDAHIYTTESVGKTLDEHSINNTVVSGHQIVDKEGFNITLSEADHAVVHGSSPNRVVTVRVAEFLYYPSDSFITTNEPVKVLALPTSGPWYKVTESIDFANAIDSEYILATHNGLNSEAGNSVTHHFLETHIPKDRKFVFLNLGESSSF